MVLILASPAYQRVDYNHVPLQVILGEVPGGARACQPHELLPAGTRALRIYIASTGSVPPIRIALLGAGPFSGTGAPARVAPGPSIVGALPHPLTRQSLVNVCLVNAGPAGLSLPGAVTGPADQIVLQPRHGTTRHLPGRVRIDELVSESHVPGWRILKYLPERIATATGTPLGPWLAGLGLVATFVMTFLILRLPASVGIGRESLVIALLPLATGALWAGVTPALQKTDETSHFAYVQALSELGHPPRQLKNTGYLSAEFSCWYNGLGVTSYRFVASERPPWASAVRHELDGHCAHPSRRYDGAMYQAFQPPLYYGLASLGYLAGSDLPLPARLMLARLVSVLIAAALVVLCYLLVRELVPDSPWSARGAAAVLALQPIAMFNLSGVNPDGLYSAAAAAAALLIVRAWRRGLNLGVAAAIGAAFGVGLLSKVNFLTALPPLLVLVLALSLSASGRRIAYAVRLLAGAAMAVGLLALYVLVNRFVWHRSLSYLGGPSGHPGHPGRSAAAAAAAAAAGHGGSLHRLLSFSWQFFLPRLPGMHNLTGVDYIPLWHDFVTGSLTRLGWWNDYGMAAIFRSCLLAAGVILVIAAAVHVVPRVRVRPWPFLAAAACGLTFLAALVYADYRFTLNSADAMEARYLLPALPLLALVVGSAIASVRPRWRPSATSLLAGLGLVYTVAALVTTINRFYL